MNVNVYEKQIDYLRSRTDMVNSALESALIPTLSKVGGIERVREYIFDGEYALAHNPGWRLVFKTDRVFFKKSDRVKTKIKDTISFTLKENETMYDLAKTYNIPIDTLIKLNANIPVDSMVNGTVKDFQNTVIHTDIPNTVENLNKYGIINKFLTFLDGHYISMNNVYVETDIINDYIIVDLRGLKDWSTIKDYTKLRLMYYEYATEDSSLGFGSPMFIFDDKGELNFNTGKTKVWTTDPCLYHYDYFSKDNIGFKLNELLKPFTFRQKIKPQNIMAFQEGQLTSLPTVETHNGNVVNVIFSEFKERSKIVVFYNTRVEYTQDNVLRLSKDKLESIAETYQMYLDMLENSCERFIQTIYELHKSDPDGEKYGFVFEEIRLNGLEEGNNSVDELIYYTKDSTRIVLNHIANEIFESDSNTIKKLILDIISNAFYDVEREKPVKFEWNLRKCLPEMFKYTAPSNLPYLDNYSALDESFNFWHDDYNTYEKNLLDAIKYIAEYDADKLERALPRNVYTLSFKGKDIRKFVIGSKLVMGRYNFNENHRRNYVMIFKNGELLDTYHTIVYDYLNFTVNINDFSDEDTFDFVYFLFCNNIIFPMPFNDNMIQNITVFNHGEVQVFDKKIKDNSYNISGNGLAYSLPFTIDLPWVYKETTGTPGGGGGGGDIPSGNFTVLLKPGVVLHFDDNDLSIDNFIYFNSDETLQAALTIIDNDITDSEMNAIFHTMAEKARTETNINDELALREHLSDTLSSDDGIVDTVIAKIIKLKDAVEEVPEEPETPSEEEGETTKTVLIDDKELYKIKFTEEDLVYYKGDTVIVCSKRQFRYKYTVINEEGVKSIPIGEEFLYCVNQNQYLVFVNHRLLPRTYVVATPLKDTPVTECRIYFNIDLRPGDIVEVFYISEPMYNDFNPTVKLKKDNTTSGYIQINKSETLVGLNKNSALVFVNGKKISYADILDVCNNTIKVLDTSTSKDSMTLSLDIYRYLQSNENITLKGYDVPSKLDKLIPETTEKTDDALNVQGKEPMAEEPEFFNTYDKDTIRNLLYEDYISSSLDDSWIAFF